MTSLRENGDNRDTSTAPFDIIDCIRPPYLSHSLLLNYMLHYTRLASSREVINKELLEDKL